MCTCTCRIDASTLAMDAFGLVGRPLSSAARPLAPIYPPRPGAGWHYLLLASLPISSYKKYCIILDRNSWPALIYWDHVPQRLQNVPCLSGARNIGVLDRRGKHGVGSIIGRRGKHGGRSPWRLLPGGEDVHANGLCAEANRQCKISHFSTINHHVITSSHHHITISSSVISQHHRVSVGVTRINQNSQQRLRAGYLRGAALRRIVFCVLQVGDQAMPT